MMDDAERELFAASVGQATSATSGAALDAALADIGWSEALAVEPRIAISTLFEAQGATGATSATLGTVVSSALDLHLDGATAVVLPRLGTATPPGRLESGCVPTPEVRVRGVGLGELRRQHRALVLADRDGELHAIVVETSSLAGRPVTGLDPALELVEVDTSLATSGSWQPVAGDWAGAVATSQRALAHELMGAMRTMLRLAREHALDRVQFGRPIAGFQAIRHKLAECLIAIEAADAALDGAWQDGSPFTATVAKAVAGHSARTVRRHCQQVLAGIGFTTEHDLHRSVRRTMTLDAMCGDARSLSAQIGTELIEARRLPSILPL